MHSLVGNVGDSSRNFKVHPTPEPQPPVEQGLREAGLLELSVDQNLQTNKRPSQLLKFTSFLSAIVNVNSGSDTLLRAFERSKIYSVQTLYFTQLLLFMYAVLTIWPLSVLDTSSLHPALVLSVFLIAVPITLGWRLVHMRSTYPTLEPTSNADISGLIKSLDPSNAAPEAAYLQRTESAYVLLLTLCLTMHTILRTFATDCDAADIASFFYCNPNGSASALPLDGLVLSVVSPIGLGFLLRGVPMRHCIVAWALAASALFVTMAVASAWTTMPTFLYVLCFSGLSVFHAYKERLSRFDLIVAMRDTLAAKDQQMNRRLAEVRRQSTYHTVSSLSHDLRTPLQSFEMGIENMVQSLSTGIPAVEELQDCIHHMKSTYRMMVMNIGRLLDFAKVSSGISLQPKVESVPLKDCISNCVSCIEALQGRIKVSLDVPPFILSSVAFLDVEWFEENVLCLLSNAVKYTKSGGSVRLALRLVQGQLRVEVHDRGSSLTPKEVLQIFRPFHAATERKDAGVGIGLHILYHRVKACKGTCGVTKRPDGESGSVFWFQIPFNVDDSFASSYHAAPSLYSPPVLETIPETASMNSIKIPEEGAVELTPDLSLTTISGHTRVLVVEDSLVILKMVCKLLEQSGSYKVDAAENGAIALDLINGGRQYDVVLTDIQMPVMDGIQLTTVLRANASLEMGCTLKRPLLIVAMTANSNAGFADMAYSAGVNKVLFKPFKKGKFDELVQAYLENSPLEDVSERTP